MAGQAERADSRNAGAAECFARGFDAPVALLTGGGDRPYAYGLATALTRYGTCVEFVGSDQLESPELRANPRVTFLNLRGSQADDAAITQKVLRLAAYYLKLIGYSWTARPRIFHILWNNRVELFDRTLLMAYYRLLGKKVVLTAHNVNVGKRDSNDSTLNRATLKTQYRLSHHIFVHTDAMKAELVRDFSVRPEAITVIPLGINDVAPSTSLTPAGAKKHLGIAPGERTILFFGHIGPYKGLEYLASAFHVLLARTQQYRLIVAGKPKMGAEDYWRDIQAVLGRAASRDRVIQRIGFIPDEDTEVYFKAADLLVLPYVDVCQSGVLVLGYTFGLPVVATDVGAFREDVVEGRTGFVCRSRDAEDLARAIETYFASDLFARLEVHRRDIQAFARERYSWDTVRLATQAVYARILRGRYSSR